MIELITLLLQILGVLLVLTLVACVILASKLFGPKTELWIGDEAVFTDIKDGKRSQVAFPSCLPRSKNQPKELVYLSVVVPAYDEEQRLHLMVDEVTTEHQFVLFNCSF